MALAAPEDRALVDGRVYTGSRVTEALLVEDGRVVSVGTSAEVLREKGTGTSVVLLRGHLVTPGLIDAHFHLAEVTLTREGVDLRGVRNIAEMLARTKAWMVQHPRGPVLGWGWDQENFQEKRYPTHADIDPLSADRPIILRRVCGHAALLNSAALEMLELGENPPDPPCGRYGRDGTECLNGILFDNALLGLPRFSLEALKADPESIRRTLQYAASTGLTTVSPVESAPEEIDVSARLAHAAPLPSRLRFYIDLRHLDSAPKFSASDRPEDWRLSGVKAETDGSLGARTAWLFEPYSDQATEGFPLWTDEQLADGLDRARDLGLQPALHAIGDRAMDRVLRVLEAHPSARRPRIEHASLTPPTLFDRLDRVKPHLVVQPHFVVTDWWVLQRLGPQRARWTYCFRSLLERGHSLAGSSDAPVEPLDPWTGLEAAVARAPGTAFGDLTASERLSPEWSFRIYTRGAGEALEEPLLGSLTPGAPADYLVLKAPSLDAAIGLGRKALMETWRGGRPTWTASADVGS